MSANPIRDRVSIAATAVGTALLLVFLGLKYWPQLLAPEVTVRQLTPATGSVGSVSGNPLDLSVFDQPRILPEIHFADEESHDLTLADFRGRVVLLNLWATWCVPCRKEMPALDRLQARFDGNDFLVIPLSIDRGGVAPVKRFYQELGLEKLGIYVDPSGKGSRALAIPGVPTTLLIDRQGREIARKMGPAEWDGAEMVSRVEQTIHAGSASGGKPDR